MRSCAYVCVSTFVHACVGACALEVVLGFRAGLRLWGLELFALTSYIVRGCTRTIHTCSLVQVQIAHLQIIQMYLVISAARREEGTLGGYALHGVLCAQAQL